ncbi:MAG: chromate transporter, partial [Candidatus Binataceae bacterium]
MRRDDSSAATTLGEIAALFLRLGLTAFGGPAAHVAMMEHECVVRRRWLSREDFLDMLGVANLIPGPTSTETAILIGHRRAGWKGLVVAGACFILPAALITMAMAWLYVAFGSLPKAQGFLYGAKPVIIAVVFQALWRLAGVALKTPTLTVVAALGLVAGLLGLNVLLILFGAGILIAAIGWAGERRAGIALGAAPLAAAATV